MTKLLELPPDLTERIISEQISDADLVQAVRRMVEHQSKSQGNGTERAAEFRAWVASHRDISAVVLDDTREAIYGDEERT